MEGLDAYREIVQELVKSKELAPLWDRLPVEQRANVGALPVHIWVYHDLTGANKLPWFEFWTRSEQRRQARKVAKLARDLDKALTEFPPFETVSLQRFFFDPEESKEQMFLRSLPPFASGDPNRTGLLELLAQEAAGFKPVSSQYVQRPMLPDAYQTYFARAMSSLFSDRGGHEVIAALVNLFAGGQWDAERVRKCVALSRKSKST